MKPRSLLALGLVLLSVPAAGPARAHFKIATAPAPSANEPIDWLATDVRGDPQKAGPCGSNDPATPRTNLVTKIRAGSKLHIKVTETIAHGGHYRVALAPNRAMLTDPQIVVTNNNCVSAAIQATPTLPILADGLFKHAQADFASGKVWETDVTLPMTPCADCTLQIIEFMTPHQPACLYYHCANLQIVEADAGDVPATGTVITVDAGATPSATDPATAGKAAEAKGDDNGEDDEDSPSSGRRTLSNTDAGTTCNIGWASPSGGLLVALGALGLALSRRRRRSSR